MYESAALTICQVEKKREDKDVLLCVWLLKMQIVMMQISVYLRESENESSLYNWFFKFVISLQRSLHQHEVVPSL